MRSLLVPAAVSLALLQGSAVLAERWRVEQITDDDVDDIQYRVSDTHVAWRHNHGNAAEAYYYDGRSACQVSNAKTPRLFANDSPALDGATLVWLGFANNYDLWMFDGEKATRLTQTSGRHERSPSISAGTVVWKVPAENEKDHEIYLWRDGKTVRLTENDYEDSSPMVSGQHVVWQGKNGEDWEIFLYDGTSTRQLTNNQHDDIEPRVCGRHVVWRGHDGNDWEIFLHEGGRTVRLSQNDYDDLEPRVWDGQVVWTAKSDGDSEIVLYDGISARPLTVNDYDDQHPQIHGRHVAWQGKVGDDWELFVRTDRRIRQLTDNDYDDTLPVLGGLGLVWHGKVGSDWDLFLARPMSLPAPVALPDAQAQRAAMATLREAYGGAHAEAKTPEQLSALARDMIDRAYETSGGETAAAERFALFRAARTVAVQAGDAQAALDAVEGLGESFEMEPMEVDTLRELLTRARKPDECREIARHALGRIDAATDAEDYDRAVRLAGLARSAAEKCREKALVMQAVGLQREVLAAKRWSRGVARAREKLEDDSADPQANLLVGRFLCFARGNWQQGLPMLAVGSDTGLKSVAQTELKQPESFEDRMAVADAWWDLALKATGDEKKVLLLRARHWYEQADQLSPAGLMKVKIDQRIRQVHEVMEKLSD